MKFVLLCNNGGGFVMGEIIMEFLFTIFVEGIFSMIEEFVPEKFRSEKMGVVIALLLLIPVLALLMGLVCGIVMLVESHARSILGWVLVTLAAAYILSGILLKVFRATKKN